MVAHCWHGAAVDGKSAAVRLGAGFRALHPKENTVVVVGGDGSRSGFVDLALPKLPTADVRNALSFEIGKHTPVAAEKLVWGFRTIAKHADGSQAVRLVYMRESEWSRWLDHASGLGPAVDAIIPPPAVLDPLLADRDVFFPSDAKGAGGFVMKPVAGKGREVVRTGRASPRVGEASPTPLALPFLDNGPLARLPVAEQLGYNGAVLLALYGLTHGPETDRKSWMPVPFELRPRRHRYSRLLAVGLSAYVVALLLLGFGRWYRTANDEFRRLREARRDTTQQIERLRADSDTEEFLAAVSRELDDSAIIRPPLATVLVELTRLIDSSAWVQLFDWNDGKIDLQIQTATEDAGLIQRIEASPVLGDVVPGQKTVDASGQLTIRLQMNARFDRDLESLSPDVPRAPASDAPAVPADPVTPVPPPPPPPLAPGPLEDMR